jgi:hypothetical protein
LEHNKPVLVRNRLGSIVRADNGVDADTAAELALVAPASAVATYELLYPNANDIVLGYTIDFAPAGLTRNEAAFGEQINQMQLAFARPPDDPGADKNTPMTPLIEALYAIPDLETLAAAYGQLVSTVFVAATLQQAPAGVQPSIITDDLADQVYEITAGIDLLLPNGFTIRADGNYEWSNDIANYGGTLKISGRCTRRGRVARTPARVSAVSVMAELGRSSTMFLRRL